VPIDAILHHHLKHTIMNTVISPKNEISLSKSIICIGFFMVLVAVPLFLLVSFMKDFQPSIIILGFTSMPVFRQFGRVFNEETIAFYLACGYGAMISISFFTNLMY
jgi:hypothetical protein